MQPRCNKILAGTRTRQPRNNYGLSARPDQVPDSRVATQKYIMASQADRPNSIGRIFIMVVPYEEATIHLSVSVHVPPYVPPYVRSTYYHTSILQTTLILRTYSVLRTQICYGTPYNIPTNHDMVLRTTLPGSRLCIY